MASVKSFGNAAGALVRVRAEWTRTADDVLRRRTTCFYRGAAVEETTGRVENVLAARLPG